MLASRNKVINFLKNDNAIIILVLMAILSSFFVDGMTRQFDTVILEASIYGILAVGLGVVLVTGNIDLSIGFQAATCSIVTVSVFNMTNGNFLFACVATLVAGAAMGLFNAFTVVKLGITPLIATIAATTSTKGSFTILRGAGPSIQTVISARHCRTCCTITSCLICGR